MVYEQPAIKIFRKGASKKVIGHTLAISQGLPQFQFFLTCDISSMRHLVIYTSNLDFVVAILEFQVMCYNELSIFYRTKQVKLKSNQLRRYFSYTLSLS